MLFNSYIFILVFLPLCFLIYFLLNNFRNKIFMQLFLITASLLFYSFGNITSFILISGSVVFNYFAGYAIQKTGRNTARTLMFSLSIAVNILFILFIKFHKELSDLYNFLFAADYHVTKYIFLTISFLTFQQIIYLTDCYRDEVKENNPLKYLLIITFFPKLIAGPLTRYSEITPQFSDTENLSASYKNIASGIFIFCIGLFKKVVIADTFAIWANMGFDYTTYSLNIAQAWVTSLSYTFQILFDISGYADMAVGAALLFNIRLPFNFDLPYKACNIIDFWERWHITLTGFFKNYIYRPLTNNSDNNFKIVISLFITLIIAGAWHGFNLTFITWSLFHFTGISVFLLWNKLHIRLPKWISWLITFNFINISWIFFRAETLADAKKVIAGMINLPNIIEYYNEHYILWGINASYITIIMIALCFVSVFYLKSTEHMLKSFKPDMKHIIITIIAAVLSMLFFSGKGFIYYGF